jgi:RimJ/RimL family protein N-acetyltransferase
VVIRDIRIEEAPAYKRLREQLDAESDTWGADSGERFSSDSEVTEFIRTILSDQFSKLFVIEDETRIVGFISAIAGKWRRGKHFVDINLGILSSHCGRGLGAKLFKAVESWGAPRGVRKLELFVREDNLRARKLYEKLGFEVEGVRRESLQVNGQFFNEVWMAKFLDR